MQCTQTVSSFRMKTLDASVSGVYRMDVKVIMPNSLGDQLFNWVVGIYAIAKKTNIQLETLEDSSRAGIQERVSKYGNHRPRQENFYCAVKMLHKISGWIGSCCVQVGSQH
jgi:hypothetical protein